MDLLSSLTKAQENKYFKPVQEEAILRIKHQLQRTGSIEKAAASSSSHPDVLSEILAHQVPLDLDKRLTELRTKREFISRPKKQSTLSGVLSDLSRPTYVEKLTLGASLSTSRGKYSSASLSEASLFNVNDAAKLILDESAKHGHRYDRLAHTFPKRPEPVLEVAGIPLKLFPEPTAGRALFWGTICACWIGAGTCIAIKRQLDINSVSDIKEKFGEVFQPFASSFKELAKPMSDQVHSSEKLMNTASFSGILKSNIAK